MKNVLLGAAFAALMAPVAAHADIAFAPVNTGGIGEVNILFNATDTGTTIQGEIDHTGIMTTFRTLTGQTLQGSGNGQADIQALPNPGNTLMTSIEMTAQAGTAWGDVIIDMDAAGNPCGGMMLTCGSATVTALDNTNHSFTTTLANGTNFVTMTTSNGEFITDVRVTENAPDPTTGIFGWTDFKQPRVSGPCILGINGSCSLVEVPEPSSLPLLAGGLMLLGMLGWRYR